MATQQPVASTSFDYSGLSAAVAAALRAAARRIQGHAPETLADLIDIGNELRSVKDYLEHGQFGPWLRSQIGWSRRRAQLLVNVAKRFVDQKRTVALLVLRPTALYFLAATAVPERARQVALERAALGERITLDVAKDIVRQVCRGRSPKPRAMPSALLGPRLRVTLQWYRERWRPEELAEFTRQLREFAAEVNRPKKG